MTWNHALALILQHIAVGVHLNPELQYRYILAGPDYICTHYDYNGAKGYRVNIGAQNYVEIPILMLKVLFDAAIANGSIYNNEVFGNNYPQQLNNHDCHVHVVGRMFVIAGVANQVGNDFHVQ